MFYEIQPKEQRENYKMMLRTVGSLSKLFSESSEPYLYYRCHENIFCKYFEALNLSREDCSADAQKDEIGIGLKTWVGADNQKVAEFNTEDIYGEIFKNTVKGVYGNYTSEIGNKKLYNVSS